MKELNQSYETLPVTLQRKNRKVEQTKVFDSK
jgi:hypothetical protein